MLLVGYLAQAGVLKLQYPPKGIQLDFSLPSQSVLGNNLLVNIRVEYKVIICQIHALGVQISHC